MPTKYAMECEGKASLLRLRARHETDEAVKSQMLSTAERYEGIAKSLRKLNAELEEAGVLRPRD